MKTKIKKLNTGFTLIETMISVALFIVIVMAGMTSLLNANLLQQKSTGMRSIIDNLSFVMDDMSRNLRTGYDYECISNGAIPSSVNTINSAGGISGQNCGGIAFISTADNTTAAWGYLVSYNPNYSSQYSIFKSVNGSIVQLTPDEVNIDTTKSGFVVSGAEAPTPNLNPPPRYSGGDQQQPFATIKLVGTINYKGITTPFSLQTSVSQRKLDI